MEAAYRLVDNCWDRLPLSPERLPDLDQRIAACCGTGAVHLPGREWGWAFPLMYRNAVEGALVVSAAERPSREQIQILMVLANQTAAALARAALHRRDAHCTEQLANVSVELAGARQQLQSRANVHKTIEAALGSGKGEQGIIDALHALTSLPIALEDRFGNLRCWSGPGRPEPYPRPEPQHRHRQLAALAARHGPMRVKSCVSVLVSPRGENLGVLSIVDPRNEITADDIFALHFACTLLGYELAHQRSLMELEQNLRRELLDDLLAGTDDDGAIARATAFGHDLRRPHHVVVVHSSAGSDSVMSAVGRAGAALHLNALRGRNGQLVVLLSEGRPDAHALHRSLSDLLNPATCSIGVGSRCEVPSDVPQSFGEARRALSVRLHSAAPVGVCAYDELGFYRLIDAAHEQGAVDDFIRQWLGALLDYDAKKRSELVFTLSQHLESGGNYDDSAKALHIHRSTLRYRLARIGELTGWDLRDVDVRFNLHAATRAWRFLHSDSVRLAGTS
ncbi:hypothetical protein AWC12_01130 [Mycolicibacterium iranicum]|uniref:PucR family transcriptional regulator n=2 Tax=Mycolicibacterium iranicum TaxID=912594 RepID=A0A1X1X2B8_MYCIR|nr:hypothetical protein AWC12_01130 [Mycolicibacterium iranicum]